MAELGDHWQATLVLVAANKPHHAFDERRLEAGTHHLGRLPAAIDQEHQQSIDFGIGQAQLFFVGLPDPQIAARRLVENLRRQREVARQLRAIAFCKDRRAD